MMDLNENKLKSIRGICKKRSKKKKIIRKNKIIENYLKYNDIKKVYFSFKYYYKL